jgi:hypothetical protein
VLIQEDISRKIATMLTCEHFRCIDSISYKVGAHMG